MKISPTPPLSSPPLNGPPCSYPLTPLFNFPFNFLNNIIQDLRKHFGGFLVTARFKKEKIVIPPLFKYYYYYFYYHDDRVKIKP